MSVTFHGRLPDGHVVALDIDDCVHLNMSNGNARAFLEFLGLESGPDLSGETTVPEARRTIIRARATFPRRVRGYTRPSSDTKRPGRCRVIEGGLNEHYFERRLDDFERFTDVVGQMGATFVSWG